MHRFSISNYSFLFILVAVLAAFGLPAQRVSATDMQVDDSCTLHDAIVAANTDAARGGCPAGDAADTIHLTGDVTLSEALPVIKSIITIDGDGHTISGDGEYRIFEVTESGKLQIHDLKLTEGYAEIGGSVLNHGDVSIRMSTLNKNEAVVEGGAIYSAGSLSIEGSFISENVAEDYGAIAMSGTAEIRDSIIDANSDGAIGGTGRLSIINSQISNNDRVNLSEGVFYKDGGAIKLKNSILTIIASRFVGNRANGSGGAIFTLDSRATIESSAFTYNRARSGGVFESYGNFGGSSWKVSNSTFSHNEAAYQGGAIWMQHHVEVMLNHVTIANNSAKAGGAIFNRHGKLSILNSIIAGNSPNDCAHVIKRNEGSLIQRGNCDQALRADPLLLPLTGSPAYHPLRDYSPAINAASDKHCLETDQAGNPRPIPAGKACDIGAVESVSGIKALPIAAPSICTLEDQIIAANSDAPSGACPAGNGHDTIELTEDVILPAALPPVTSQITIEGQGHTLSGDNHYQVFQVNGGDLTINELTIKHGYGIEGGAIGVTNGGALTINNSVICENAAEIYAGAIFVELASRVDINGSVICDNTNHGYNGGAIQLTGESALSIKDSRITGNTVRDYGGGVYLRGSDASISESIISGNRAGLGGAIYSRGPAQVTIDRSSVYDNTSYHDGGAISVWKSDLAIQNSTISDNRATRLSWEEGYSSGGGIRSSDSAVSLHHVTLAYNRAGDGGGLGIYSGSLDMRNSIIAHNEGGDCFIRAEVDMIEDSGNFFGDGTCDYDSSSDAYLLPLTESMPYHSLKPESPAINAADPGNCLPVDQLGHARPAGDSCDIGAIESPYESAIEPTPAPHCTLADQILAANRDAPVGACPAGDGADTIHISSDVTLESALPPITSEVALEGNGFTISGYKRFQIFYVIGGKLTVNNLTLIDGVSYAGGAIRVRNGGELTINNSDLRGNSAVAGGAILINRGKLTIDGSSIQDNHAEYQGGALHASETNVRISRSAINENGSERSGGAIYFEVAEAELINSTVSGNTAGMWGGAFDALGGHTDLVHVTIAGNSAPNFGGISGNSVDVDLYNSILANNSGGDCDGTSQYGPWVSSWSSLIGDASCDAALSGKPMLHELDQASGVQPLRDESPAIDIGDPEYCPEQDQLGNPRPRGASCDIGAVEYVGE